jgi:hypothetical protein
MGAVLGVVDGRQKSSEHQPSGLHAVLIVVIDGDLVDDHAGLVGYAEGLQQLTCLLAGTIRTPRRR